MARLVFARRLQCCAWLAAGLIGVTACGGSANASHSLATSQPTSGAPGMSVPAGFHLDVFARGLSTPRYMAVAPNGDLLVSEPDIGDVLAFSGPFASPATVASGLNVPHGLVFAGSTLYIADWDGVSKMTY